MKSKVDPIEAIGDAGGASVASPEAEMTSQRTKASSTVVMMGRIRPVLLSAANMAKVA